MTEPVNVSSRSGPSDFTSFSSNLLNKLKWFHKTYLNWQERRDSNPQPPVLETGALPVELHSSSYEIISVTTPDPTVRPPSRIAKRTPLSIAIGAISSISIAILSPGITISVPSGSLQTPVTSVVLK